MTSNQRVFTDFLIKEMQQHSGSIISSILRIARSGNEMPEEVSHAYGRLSITQKNQSIAEAISAYGYEN